MKVVDKKLVFIKSNDRTNLSDPVSNCSYILPKELLSVDANQELRMTLCDFVCIFSWYNTDYRNNQFALFTSTNNDPSPQWHVITFPEGNYNILNQTQRLQDILNDPTNSTFNVADYGVNGWTPPTAAQYLTWTCSWDEITGKITITAVPTTGGTFINAAAQLDFVDPHTADTGVTSLLVSSYQQLGFTTNPALNPYVFAVTPVVPLGTSQVIKSTTIATIAEEEAVYIRTNQVGYNLQKAIGLDGQPSTEADAWERSDVLARVPLTCAPYSNVVYMNLQDDYSMLLPTNWIGRFDVQITDEDKFLLDVQKDYQLTLKIETMEETEVELNETLEELVEINKISLLKQK